MILYEIHFLGQNYNRFTAVYYNCQLVFHCTFILINNNLQ
jgi:hypothetical protein